MLKNYKELQIDQNAIRCEVVEFLKQEGCTMKTFSKKVGLAYTTVLKFLKHDINIHISTLCLITKFLHRNKVT